MIHVRAQLSRAHRGAPARVAPKTPASVRDIPIVAHLARLLAANKQHTPFAAGPDWVFATSRGTTHGHRNVTSAGYSARRESLGWMAATGRRCDGGVVIVDGVGVTDTNGMRVVCLWAPYRWDKRLEATAVMGTAVLPSVRSRSAVSG